jgi:phage N-6-adenine-methyltransferase
MSNETQHVESGNSPPVEVRESEARASRIHSLLKLRDKAETEIAAVLREHLDEVGEPAWLEWCEREFGWKRTAAYNHLHPERLQKDRDRAGVGVPTVTTVLAPLVECDGQPPVMLAEVASRLDEEREAKPLAGKVTLSAAKSKWEIQNGNPNAEQTWETPLDLYKELDAEFHFELGPAASDSNAKTPRWFTKEQDGLKQSWATAPGKSVYVNPPYNDIPAWLKKAREEVAKGATVVFLLPARTSTTWWAEYVGSNFPNDFRASEVRFLSERLHFTHPTLDPKGERGAPFACAVIVYRPKPEPPKPKSSTPTLDAVKSDPKKIRVKVENVDPYAGDPFMMRK